MARADNELLRPEEKLEEIVAQEKKRRLLASAQAGVQLTDSDALLIDPGHLVRPRFTGCPSRYSATAQSRGPGLFSGVVASIDPIPGEPGRFHLLVRPAEERIRAGLDPPWPPVERLRPGTRVSGTVLLNRVPLWHELWRRFNVSPPVGKKGTKIDAPGTEKTGASKP